MKVNVDDLDSATRTIIEAFKQYPIAEEAIGSSTILRDKDGNVSVNNIILTTPASNPTAGELAFRGGPGQPLEFCNDPSAARKLIGATKLHITEEEPVDANTGDVWIGGG